MRYSILGTTQALHDDGTAVAIGGARLRALLTVLALSPGRAVPAAVLVDEVWDGEPPADAVGALQALVGRLRRVLGHEAITSAESGYRLAADPDAVDLHRFDRLTGRGCGPWSRAIRPRPSLSSTMRSPCGGARSSPICPTAAPSPPAGRPVDWTPGAPGSPRRWRWAAPTRSCRNWSRSAPTTR